MKLDYTWFTFGSVLILGFGLMLIFCSGSERKTEIEDFRKVLYSQNSVTLFKEDGEILNFKGCKTEFFVDVPEDESNWVYIESARYSLDSKFFCSKLNIHIHDVNEIGTGSPIGKGF